MKKILTIALLLLSTLILLPGDDVHAFNIETDPYTYEMEIEIITDASGVITSYMSVEQRDFIFENFQYIVGTGPLQTETDTEFSQYVSVRLEYSSFYETNLIFFDFTYWDGSLSLYLKENSTDIFNGGDGQLKYDFIHYLFIYFNMPQEPIQGDGFTVYTLKSTYTFHNFPIPEDLNDDGRISYLDMPNHTIFVNGILVLDRGVLLDPDSWEISNGALNLSITDIENGAIGVTLLPNGNVYQDGYEVVMIVADDPDSFEAWSYPSTDVEVYDDSRVFDAFNQSYEDRLSIIASGQIIYELGADKEGYTSNLLSDTITFLGNPLQDIFQVNNEGYIDNTFGYNIVVILESEVAYNPIYTVENIADDYNFNTVNYGFVSIDGLYQFSDIELLVIDSEPFIIDGELNTSYASSHPGFDIADMFIENNVIKYTHDTLGVIDLIWVAPGKLYATGLFEDPSWGFEVSIEALPVEMDYIYRAPGITGTAVFITNVDSPIAEGQIRASITAFDLTDGDITDQIVKSSDDYTSNMNTVGEWDITYSVTDSSSNVVTFTVTVFVRDIEDPTIDLGAFDEITLSYQDEFNPSTYHTNFTISDNYYSLEDLTITVDLGTYDGTPRTSSVITYTVTDPSGNEASAAMTVHIVDDVDPAITGPDSIATTASSGLTLGNIVVQYTANDAIDGVLTSYLNVISNTFSANKYVAGVYEIILEVSDISGNVAQKTIEVTVTDDIVPVFYVTRSFISVAESITLDFDDIIRILYATGQIDSMEGYTLLSSTYFGNESTPGFYTLTLTDGVQLLSINVEVFETAPTLYLVQYVTNGAALMPNELVEEGSTLDEPTEPTRTGYTFGGWFVNQALTIQYDFTQVVTGDLVLYAKWVVNTGGGDPITPEPEVTSNLIYYVMGGIAIIMILGLASKKKKGF